MDSQIIRRVRLLQGLSSDRRSSVRVPVNLEVRYSVAGRRGPVENRSGQTIDVSSSGLSFTADRPLPIGQKLDLSIDWPFQLDGDQLQLVASGVVVRTTGVVTALRIERYELRTRRAGLKVVPRLESVG
jgi:c-di-GMP-binding flagellar brake protein YcgR